MPARVEVSGSLYGWDVRSDRTGGPATHSGGADDNATVTFSRSRGPLALIFGICLVLLMLPALALYAAIEMLLGKKKFQPPFSTWFAAMLFAVVPIRNVLPGDPPPGPGSTRRWSSGCWWRWSRRWSSTWCPGPGTATD